MRIFRQPTCDQGESGHSGGSAVSANNPFNGAKPVPGWQVIYANSLATQTLTQPNGTTLFFKGAYDFTGATVTGLEFLGFDHLVDETEVPVGTEQSWAV
jgi:hypothetical protein